MCGLKVFHRPDDHVTQIQTSAVLTHVASCALASSVVGSHLVQMGYGFYLLFLPGDATDGKDLLSDPLIAPRSAVGKQPPFCRRHRAAPFTTSVASSNIHREKSSITRRWQQSPSLSSSPARSVAPSMEGELSVTLTHSLKGVEGTALRDHGRDQGWAQKEHPTSKMVNPIFNDLFQIRSEVSAISCGR